MNADGSRFRRPAQLFAARAEEIPGAPDPAASTEAAHSSAAALLHGVYRSAEPEVVERVVRLATEEGLEDLAALWSGSPADTLPGALWRLYVLHAWVQQNTPEVVRRYEAGLATAQGRQVIAGIAEPPTVAQVRATLDEILRGAFTGDLAIALHRAAAVAAVAAHGSAVAADQELGTDAQHEATVRADRLLRTSEDLETAAREAERARLT